jgi:C4-type Zn-finger protein
MVIVIFCKYCAYRAFDVVFDTTELTFVEVKSVSAHRKPICGAAGPK